MSSFQNDTRIEWLRRRVTKCLEISNALFDEMYQNKIDVDTTTLNPKLSNGKNPQEMGELELKHYMNDIGISTNGNKDELQKRLIDYLREESRDLSKNIIKKFFDSQDSNIALIFNVTITKKVKRLHLCIDRLPEKIKDNISNTMYVIKISYGRIKFPDSSHTALEIDHFMSKYCEYSVLPGHSLLMLRRMVYNVYMTLLDGDASDRNGDKTDDGEEEGNHELYLNMNKFTTQLTNAIQQVHGEVNLILPLLPIKLNKRNIIEAAHSSEIVSILEESLEEWSNIIHSVVTICQESIKNNCIRKRSTRKTSLFPRKSLISGYLTLQGPISEINFWRNRNALLSGLWEQLTRNEFRLMINVLELSSIVRVQPFSIQLKELLILYTEAKDNCKFLATLERHFKNIENGNLQTMIETIPSMLNALRMVWIISRHYNTDQRILPLMDLIAIEISEKVANKINIDTISNYSPLQAMNIISLGIKVLKLWSSSYHQQRNLIFESGTDHRWEFDRKLLFEQTNYTATICQDLYSVAEVFGQFQKFLGPRLKEVTKDHKEIDELTNKVEQLKKSLENLPFNIFDQRYNASWEQMMKSFWNKVNQIEERCKILIDTSFQKLRSAESAFDLLLDFKNIECRKSIQQRMMEKFKDILIQFGKEIDLINNIFDKYHNNPPITKDQAPISGSIQWSRSLYGRIKHVVIRFQEAKDLYESDEFKLIKEKYLNTAKKIVHFEEELFKNWCKNVENTVDQLLKQPILARHYNQDTLIDVDYNDNNNNNNNNDTQQINVKCGDPLSSIIQFKSTSDRRKLLLGCLYINKYKTKIKYDKLMNMNMRANIDIDGNGHLSNNLNEMLYNFNDAIFVMNNKEHILLHGDIKLFELIRESIFEWMKQHKKTECKLNPISLRLSKYISECIQEWLALNEFISMNVNFNNKLIEIGRESKYLDRMGFDICDGAQKVYLQENKFLTAIDRLQDMLNNYEKVIKPLKYHERCAVRRCFKSLYSTLRPAFEHLNWNSLGISSFIEQCVKSIQDFNGIVSRMKQSLLQIDKKILLISNSSLIDIDIFIKTNKIIRIDDLCRKIEEHRINTTDKMLIEYQAIVPLLGKIESVVVQSETQCHPVLKELYHFVEKQIYHSLVKSIINGCNKLKEILQLKKPINYSRNIKKAAAINAGNDGDNSDNKGGNNNNNNNNNNKTSTIQIIHHNDIEQESKPLINISFLMNSPPEISIIPRIPDIHKSFSNLLKGMISTSYSFIRWEKHSCIESKPVKIYGEDDMKLYTFYDDIKDDPYVKNAYHKVSQIIQMAFTQVQQLLNEWRKYDIIYKLWDNRTLSHIDRLKKKEDGTATTEIIKSLQYFHQHIKPYYNLWNKCNNIRIYHTIKFIRIDVSSLIVQVKKKSKEWIDKYCSILLDNSNIELLNIHSEMNYFENNLKLNTDNIDQLQFVLSIIQNIQANNMKMLLQFDNIFEKYQCLKEYKYSDIPQENILILNNIKLRWNDLMFESKKRDIELLKVKEKFTSVTKELVNNFMERTINIKKEFIENGPDQNGITLETGYKLMEQYKNNLNELIDERTKLVNAQKLFGIEITVYPQLNYVENYMNKLFKLFKLYKYHKNKEKKWSDILWQELDVNILEIGCNDSLNKINGLNESLKELNTFRKVFENIESFKKSLPLISSLKTDALRDRHWNELMELTGIIFDVHSTNFTLGKLFEMKLHRFGDKISSITYGAEQERKIEKKLASIKLIWNKKIFPLHKYKNIAILGDTSEMESDLEDDVLNLQTLLNSRFVIHFRSDVIDWDKNLNLVTECIKIWITVQQKWMYLEGIFIGSEDIRIQLKQAALSFDNIHNEFKKLMETVETNPNAVKTCKIPKRLNDLKRLSNELDQCQRSLSNYLESKRNSFPRFFFISDDELLSMLGTSDPTSVQDHCLKLFVNCKKLKFRGNNIIGMESSEKEYFDFNQSVEANGKVEKWMNKVQDNMRNTLHLKSKQAIFYYPKQDRIKWIFDNLGMIGILGCQIWWTWNVENAFKNVKNGDKNGMKKLNNKLSAQITNLVKQVRSSNLNKNERKKINTLIIIDVHARDIISTFVRDCILDSSQFEWESQLRFYWDKDIDNVLIKQCTGLFNYGFEYMGLNGRLVITPLTDRCIMTLTQALTFNMGGAPAGPAGTGKTETIKDLAKSLAIPCFVTNCGEGLDYKAMGNIFSGLIQIGAWGCFDEFNRIELEVLSVVSTQLRLLLNAIKQKIKVFEFLGRDISCDPRCGFFITMNPGYAGRAELPDNLKSLFRPVTMIVPDMEQICEIMLFSEGFAQARMLAKKMCVLYKLSREQLSKQYHYDFGLRALKSVLVMAGALKRGSSFSEDMTLMRALRDMNAPKFVYEDVPLFLQLINDLFPGLDCPRIQHEILKISIIDDLNKNNYQYNEKQIDKIVQLYETMLTRHTCMIVGPTQGGKSVVIETLSRSYKQAFKTNVKLFRLNPKSQTVSELYGVLDPVTREWKDGILSKIFRNINEPIRNSNSNSGNSGGHGNTNELRWLLFDGDVDTMWVESMNSVMDDNKLLTLPNGERIMLQDHVKLLVEVYDLQYASPATISRCGMVYVDPKDLKYLPYFKKWIKYQLINTNNDEQEILLSLGNKYLESSLEFVLDGTLPENGENGKCTLVLPQCQLNMIKQLCAIYQSICLLDINNNDSNSRYDPDIIESIFIFSLIWSIGGTLLNKDRIRFDKYIKKLSLRTLVSVAGKNKLPKDKTLYDYCFDLEKFQWYPWNKFVNDYIAPIPFEFNKVMVPTIDTVRNNYFLNHFVSSKESILFVGESGTAKTIIIQNYLSSCNLDRFSTLTINFSSRTTSLDLQKNLMDNIEKRGPVWLPPNGKQLLVFIDDLNMPNVDIYGTQQPIALLKFLIEKGIMYERDNDLEQINTKNLYWIAAMPPPGGGRNHVDTRFISLFNTLNIVFPSKQSLHKIYSSILNQHVKLFNVDIQIAAEKITHIILKFYDKLISTLPPTPSKFHYIFNLRDLSRIYQGLCQSIPDKYNDIISFVRLFRNETLRVIHDRLISIKDKEFVDKILLKELIENNFSENETNKICADPILYGDYLDINNENKENLEIYQDLQNYSNIKNIFNKILEKYNKENESKQMNLVLFEDALEHLTRIHRILKIQRGNALLVGVGGSGKQSLTKLATFAAGYQLFEISLTRNYGENEFREDLKKLYGILGTSNGGKGKSCTFLITDAHVKTESFLELINNMLTSGMVPALFEEDEKLLLIDNIRDEVNSLGINPSKENCWKYFINRCRNNLHVVLAMSPNGDILRKRCRNFPGMISNCVIDWFYPWPKDALYAVAKHFVDCNDDNIIKHIVNVHLSVNKYSKQFELEMRRKIHITPKNYLDFLLNYKIQLNKFQNANISRIKKLEGGLNQLIKASENVSILRTELTQQNKIVNEKSMECSKMINEIQEKTKNANEKKIAATEKKEQLKLDEIEIAKEKKLAEEALEEALPALELARQALKNLKKEDIAEVKVLANPKDCVKNVCLCVLGLKPSGTENINDGWSGARAMMGDAAFLSKLKNYPRDNMTEIMYKKVNKILKSKPKDKTQTLTMDNLQRVSKAGAGLLQWVIAMMRYYDVAKEVAPRRKKVQEMEKKMLSAQRDLSKTEKDLFELETQIKLLSDNFKSKDCELKDLQKQAKQMAMYLDSAAKLIEGLTTEKERWTKDKQELKIKSNLLIGDCLLASSFLSYTGPFSFEYRKNMVYNDWFNDIKNKNIPITDNFRVENLLITEIERSQWISDGLPSDELSIQNGILTTRSSRYPLCIDPQMQAINWIKSKESINKYNIRTFQDIDFIKILELSIQFGNPFIFEGVDEEIDPIIDTILEQEFITSNNNNNNNKTKQIKLGDNILDWDDNFRLYLVSKLSSPNYSPEIAGKTMIINFCVTKQGLEDQLLDVVVEYERPDLQKQRQELIQTMSKNNILLAQLEDLLLKELTEATGNILENKILINTLQDAKAKSISIEQQLKESKITSIELNKVASQYRLAAKRGSILFFSLSSLSIISRMYEYSLSSYLQLFILSLSISKKDSVIKNRLKYIIETLTKNVYDYVCTGIFERHKLMYSFQMATLIQFGDNKLNQNELNFFLKGNISLKEVEKNKPSQWIPMNGWKDLEKLQNINKDIFGNIINDICDNLNEWKKWYDLERPEEVKELPCNYSQKCQNKLQQLLILRCFRPDRVYNGVRNYVINAMNNDIYFVQPPVLQYDKIYKQSFYNIPIIFILSKGADPMRDLQKLAEKYNIIKQNKFKYLALGQGQAPLAQSLLELGSSRGYWVVLQNCHLMPSWLNTLEKFVYDLKNNKSKKIDKNFRLWLTTNPTSSFPIGILQSSLKVVIEPPDGLKLNIRSLYSRVTNNTLSSCNHYYFKPLIFVLSFFHAVVQERRKYGKLGWNVSYDFNESDYDTSLKILAMYLDKSDEIPWDSLKYLIGQVMYGGRVTDSFDRRTLNTYLNEYMGDFLFDSFQSFYFSFPNYKIPSSPWTDLNYFISFINKLPLENGPEIFGLHSNAEIGYYTTATNKLWSDLINLQPRTQSIGINGITREDYIASIAKSIQEKLPKLFDIILIRKQIESHLISKNNKHLQPTSVVLLQELERWNKLVLNMTQSLFDLQRALIGEIGMSVELDSLSSDLYNGYLPNLWRKYAPSTQKKLSSWINHFISRYKQYDEWINLQINNNPPKDPKVIWLSGLHIPETYLAALVQTTCRKKKWPLDKSTLFTKVTNIIDDNDIKQGLNDGCYVRGLYLEGAGWDYKNGCLCKQDPKKLIYKLPITKIIPMETNKINKYHTFKTPVYVTSQRRNAMGVGLVFEADLTTDKHQSHWILQGTAISLNVSD